MSAALTHHRDFLSALSAEQRISLTQTNNRPGVFRGLIISSLILLWGSLVTMKIPYWQVFMLPLGVLLIFLFTLMHESTHETAFASKQINRWVCRICGFLLLLPPAWFRYFHLAHHRHTQDTDKDPELQSAKPATWPHYFLHVSGILIWYGAMRTLMINAFGNSREAYLPAMAMPVLQLESRLMLSGYAFCLGASLWFQSHWLLHVWIIPILLGQPFLRLYLLAEHGRCALTNNMLDNTRTTYTNRFIRFICWNMPYHTEHHVFPTVPFHRLPELHDLLHEHLCNTEDGYYRFNRRYVESLS